jgi:hypothetical protein
VPDERGEQLGVARVDAGDRGRDEVAALVQQIDLTPIAQLRNAQRGDRVERRRDVDRGGKPLADRGQKRLPLLDALGDVDVGARRDPSFPARRERAVR